MKTRTGIWTLKVVVMVAFGLSAFVASAKGPGVVGATSKPAKATSRPAKDLGHMPNLIDQTVTKQNSDADRLRIDITHSWARKDGKHVAFVRVVWGDLQNVIKGGGRQYYSDWDGSVTLDSGTAVVARKIAFDDGTKKGPTSRPAGAAAGAASKPAHDDIVVRKPPVAKPDRLHKATTRPAKEPGAGTGRDELTEKAGKEITWKSGVVGGLDGLLIKITSDSADITGTIKAGKFTVPVKITAAPANTPVPAKVKK